jgi:hypothetical protein
MPYKNIFPHANYFSKNGLSLQPSLISPYHILEAAKTKSSTMNQRTNTTTKPLVLVEDELFNVFLN